MTLTSTTGLHGALSRQRRTRKIRCSRARCHGTILKDPIDGKFKGWTPVMSNDSPEKLGECEFRLAYIDSDDGVRWRRPNLGLVPWEGHAGTNLIFDNPSGGRTTYASVHVDREQDSAEPYEDRKSTRLNSSHLVISYAVFCLKKK